MNLLPFGIAIIIYAVALAGIFSAEAIERQGRDAANIRSSARTLLVIANLLTFGAIVVRAIGSGH
jgi:hypothetical protein